MVLVSVSLNPNDCKTIELFRGKLPAFVSGMPIMVTSPNVGQAGDCTKPRLFPSAVSKRSPSDGRRCSRFDQVVALEANGAASAAGQRKDAGNAGRRDGDSNLGGWGMVGGTLRGKKRTARGASSPLGGSSARSGPGSCRGHLAGLRERRASRPAPGLQRGWGHREEGCSVQGKNKSSPY